MLRSKIALLALLGITASLVIAVMFRFAAGIDGILWGSGLTAQHAISERVRGSKPNLGMYDPSHKFADADYVAIEHDFVSWIAKDLDARLSKLADYSRVRNRWPMVTVEPFTDGREGSSTLLEGINNGSYDTDIDHVCEKLAAMKMPIFVRFGHEMEVPTGRYPWADKDGNAYIKAYRRFVDRCREEDREFYYVWSPRGDGAHQDYFPGPDYVDHVGLSLYSYDLAEKSHYGNVRSFSEAFAERYEPASFYRKPIILAEFGVNGKSDWRRHWISEGLDQMNEFPLVQSIVYFNAPDSPDAWGSDWPSPDWRIDPKVFSVATD